MVKSLKDLRKEKNITQREAAKIADVSLRTYVFYENHPTEARAFSYQNVYLKIEGVGFHDESHGILSLEEILRLVKPIFAEAKLPYVYLFGSYARGEAREDSDVDFLIPPRLEGLAYYDLVEHLRAALGKRIDLLDAHELTENPEILSAVLEDGVRLDEKNRPLK
jgi:predicted nucleotidyltransferase